MNYSGTEFDYIICGAGAAGSVLARRLSENPDLQVLLVEAGGDDQSEFVEDPRKAIENLGGERDWQYLMQPNAAIDGRVLPLPAGKGYGGGTAINFMYWTRGNQEDWDFFAAVSGDPGWSFASMQQVYDRIEDRNGDVGYSSTARGMIPITRDVLSTKLLQAADAAFIDSGSSRYGEINGALLQKQNGHAPRERNISDGRRISAFEAYVRPWVGHAANLKILKNCFVLRLKLEKRRATGVSVLIGNEVVELRARRETILSAGAIQTPRILLSSGIGPRHELARHNITLHHHLPGVGLGLQDHALLQGCNWLSAPTRDGPAAGALVGFAKSSSSLTVSDLHLVFTGFMTANDRIAGRFGYPKGNYQYRQGWGISVGLLRPFSKGSIRLSDSNPMSHPLIDSEMLSDPRDERALLSGIALARSIGNSQSLKPFAAREISPGDLSAEGMREFLRQAVGSHFHPCCTARMGRDDFSVVDASLKVHDLEGLRIADASIMPRIPAANTMAPSIAIGERASDILKSAN